MKLNDTYNKNTPGWGNIDQADQFALIIKLLRQNLSSITSIESRLDIQEALLLEIQKHSPSVISQPVYEPIRGIHGLAEFLGVSIVTAQKLKNSGNIPFSQFGRVILFDPQKILLSLQVESKNSKL